MKTKYFSFLKKFIFVLNFVYLLDENDNPKIYYKKKVYRLQFEVDSYQLIITTMYSILYYNLIVGIFILVLLILHVHLDITYLSL